MAEPSEFQQSTPFFFDVSGDSSLSPIDALMVINYLGRLAAEGEGEFAFAASPGSEVAGLSPPIDVAAGKSDPDELIYLDLAIKSLF